MEKFTKLNYKEVETKKISDNETSFVIAPLERGFANTLGNALRRTLLSSISGVAPFAVKIAKVGHEFQTLVGVTEDSMQLILNLKTIRFQYNHTTFDDESIVRISLKSKVGEVSASDLTLPPGVEIVNPDHYIATTAKDGAIDLELFLRSGRGFVSFEKNKEFVKEVQPRLESKLKSGSIIAIDSDFSPVSKISYESDELNTASAIIQERLTLNIETDGSVSAKDVLSQGANILSAHLGIIGDVSNLNKGEVFENDTESKKQTVIQPQPLSSLDLSVRSYNCLKRAGYDTLADLASLTKRELASIKNLGKKSVIEINDKLLEYSITLEEGE